MKIKVGDILTVDDTYRIGRKVTVLVINMNLYPKAETGPRFMGKILNGGSFQEEVFKVDDIKRNFGNMSLDEFTNLFPDKLI